MSQVQQLPNPNAFDKGFWLDWADDPQSNLRLPSGFAVQGRTNFYATQHLAITVNPSGAPLAEFRVCGPVDLRCNFWIGTGLLLAPNSAGSANPTLAPLHLRLSHAVRAVGAYVSGTGVPAGTQYAALLWAKEAGSNVWAAPVMARAQSGPPLPTTSAATAAFVAVRSAQGIKEVAFDVALPPGRDFAQLALSELYYIP